MAFKMKGNPMGRNFGIGKMKDETMAKMKKEPMAKMKKESMAKMKKKSMAKKALVGKQNNLPEGLKAKIEAAPGKMKKESMAKQMDPIDKKLKISQEKIATRKLRAEHIATNKKKTAEAVKKHKEAMKIKNEKGLKENSPDFDPNAAPVIIDAKDVKGSENKKMAVHILGQRLLRKKNMEKASQFERPKKNT